MNSPNEYITLASGVFEPTNSMLANTNPALANVMSTMRMIHQTNSSVADAINAPNARNVDSVQFPESSLGDQAKSASRLISGGLRCSFYKLALTGFDTHGSQIPIHASLLSDLSNSISALRQALINTQCWDRVLIMTYSEFGRRLKENASRGSDHGLAAPHFMIGGKVRGGFYGKQPSLKSENLDFRGDLRPVIDARRYFATAASFMGFSAVARAHSLDYTNDGSHIDLTPLDCFRV
jgi:uncharacterized protein (DUF1501 family)